MRLLLLGTACTKMILDRLPVYRGKSFLVCQTPSVYDRGVKREYSNRKSDCKVPTLQKLAFNGSYHVKAKYHNSGVLIWKGNLHLLHSHLLHFLACPWRELCRAHRTHSSQATKFSHLLFYQRMHTTQHTTKKRSVNARRLLLLLS